MNISQLTNEWQAWFEAANLKVPAATGERPNKDGTFAVFYICVPNSLIRFRGIILLQQDDFILATLSCVSFCDNGNVLIYSYIGFMDQYSMSSRDYSLVVETAKKFLQLKEEIQIFLQHYGVILDPLSESEDKKLIIK